MRYFFRWVFMAALGVWLLGFVPAWCDVVVLKTGGRLEGRVLPAPGDADSIVFEDSRAQIKIARDRIREVQEESDAVDWMKIGDQYFAAKRYRDAMTAYGKSLELEPDGAAVKERIAALKQAEDRANAADRRERLKTVDAQLDKAAQDIEAADYASAAETIENKLPVDELLPAQKERVTELRKKLYRAWAFERLDKMDRAAAAENFEKYLKLNPNDEEAYNRLIDIYSKMPEKLSQVIEAHWVRLQLNPNDHMTRKKLADKYVEQANLLEVNLGGGVGDEKIVALYEKAAEQYEILYKAGNFEKSDVERRLIHTLEILSARAEKNGGLERAIAYFMRQPEPYRDAEKERLYRLEYQRDFRKLAAEDVAGRVELLKRLRKQGLDAFARQQFDQVLSQYPKDAAVLAMLKLYARESLGEAEKALHETRYEKAMSLATTVIGEYGARFEDIKLAADEVRNKASVQLEKERRVQGDEAIKYKAQGDRYFSEGKFHMDAMLSMERRNNPQLMSDKNEAIRNFNLAVENFNKALSYSGGLDEASRSAVITDRKAAQDYLARLTSTTPPPMSGPSNRLRR